MVQYRGKNFRFFFIETIALWEHFIHATKPTIFSKIIRNLTKERQTFYPHNFEYT